MLRIVARDGYCPICDQEIWFDRDMGQNMCSCGVVWVKGMYVEDADAIDIGNFLTVEVSSID